MAKCNNCDGTGLPQGIPKEEIFAVCPGCDGSGTLPEPKVEAPKLVVKKKGKK